LGCAVIGAVLIAGLAQFTIYLPFTPVPITGQTLGVLLVGAAYGPGLAAATVGLYLAAAVVGLPVLARNVEGGHDTAAHIPGSELRIVPGMGHDFPPELYGEIAEGILRAVARSKASA
jgi:biotin transport system substrate-specific component